MIVNEWIVLLQLLPLIGIFCYCFEPIIDEITFPDSLRFSILVSLMLCRTMGKVPEVGIRLVLSLRSFIDSNPVVKGKDKIKGRCVPRSEVIIKCKDEEEFLHD